MIPEDQQKNYVMFRDCLSTALLEKILQPVSKPRRTRTRHPKKVSPLKTNNSTTSTQEKGNGAGIGSGVNTGANTTESEISSTNFTAEAEDLADFTDYIATETFEALPEELKTLDYHTYVQDLRLQSRFFALPLTGSEIPDFLPTLDPTVADSLSTYGVTDESVQGINEFLAPVLTSFLTLLSTPPPPPRSTKNAAQAEGCEICERDWIPLSYHHLIPRFVHDKAVKRGWHREQDLENVAWLCGACHGFVHRFAGHEDLARKYYTVELLMAEAEVRKWADWVGRLRWKGR